MAARVNRTRPSSSIFATQKGNLVLVLKCPARFYCESFLFRFNMRPTPLSKKIMSLFAKIQLKFVSFGNWYFRPRCVRVSGCNVYVVVNQTQNLRTLGLPTLTFFVCFPSNWGNVYSQAVLTLVTRGCFLTSASKCNIEPNGGNF